MIGSLPVLAGMGNELRGDDAVGLLVLRAVRLMAPDAGRYVELGDDLARLLDEWRDAPVAVVVDAMAGGGHPGQIHVLADPGAAEASAISAHGLELSTIIGVGVELGRSPRRLIILAIEGDRFGLGEAMGPGVAAAIAPAARLAYNLLTSIARTADAGASSGTT